MNNTAAKVQERGELHQLKKRRKYSTKLFQIGFEKKLLMNLDCGNYLN